MKDPRAGDVDRRLEVLLEKARGKVRAPRGFANRVMDAVYKEALSGAPRRPGVQAQQPWRDPASSRLYRRIGWSLMVTAAVLAVSLLVPHGAYPTLVGAGSAEAALGAGPSAVVQQALSGAGEAVQGALGEKQIGRSSE